MITGNLRHAKIVLVWAHLLAAFPGHLIEEADRPGAYLFHLRRTGYQAAVSNALLDDPAVLLTDLVECVRDHGFLEAIQAHPFDRVVLTAAGIRYEAS